MDAHHELKDFFASPEPAAQSARPRVRGWFRDPALWAWIVVVLLALLPLRHAFA